MTSNRSNTSLAVAAGGFIGFAILVSGVWHPKFPAGGLTQVGRTSSVTFEDGSVLELSESDTDQAILKRRRMKGWAGHEYRQTFDLADGEQIEILNCGLNSGEDRNGLSTGDHLLLIGYNREIDDTPPTDGVAVDNLEVDGKDRVVSGEVDGKDRVVNDVIDGKDRMFADGKDVPAFQLTPAKPFEDQRVDQLLMGDGGYWNDLRTASSTGTISGGGGGSGGSGGGGGSVSIPPIGGLVPEPSTVPMFGVAGALALAFGVWRRRKTA